MTAIIVVVTCDTFRSLTCFSHPLTSSFSLFTIFGVLLLEYYKLGCFCTFPGREEQPEEWEQGDEARYNKDELKLGPNWLKVS